MRVRQFVKHLRETNTPHSVAIQIDSLYGAVRTLMPDKDWTWLLHIKTRLYAAAPRGDRVRPVITSVQLVDLGMALMEESKISAEKPISMADAIRYRDGLMFALLAQVPLRPKNAAALEIGSDVINEDDMVDRHPTRGIRRPGLTSTSRFQSPYAHSLQFI